MVEEEEGSLPGSPTKQPRYVPPFHVPMDDDAPDHDNDNPQQHSNTTIMNPLMMEPRHNSDDEDSNGDSDHHHHGGGPPGSASNVQVVINIIISFVGAGLLGVPSAIAQSGWFLGTVSLVTVSCLNLYAMMLLPKVKRKLIHSHPHASVASYGDLGRILLGRQGEMLVNMCLGVSQLGFATAYIIFIAANLYSMIRMPRWLVCLLCVPGLGFLVNLREMKHLAPFSALANSANFLALSVVLFQDFEIFEHVGDNEAPGATVNVSMVDDAWINTDPDEEDQIVDETIYAIQWSGLLYVIAITIYSMEGVGLILSLESSARNPHMFNPLLKATVGCITLFMAVFGVCGYLAFGVYTMAPITLNLSSRAGPFVKCSLCLGLYLTYPIMMFPIWSIAERLYPKMKEVQRINTNFRVGVVCCSALVAFAVPDFGKFLSLVGSSICTLLGFILPCYFHWKAFGEGKELAKWQNRLNIGLMIGGAMFGITGTCQSIWAMMHGELEGDVRRLQQHQNLLEL